MTDTPAQSSSAATTGAASQGRWESEYNGFIRPEFKRNLIKLFYSADFLPDERHSWIAPDEEVTRKYSIAFRPIMEETRPVGNEAEMEWANDYLFSELPRVIRKRNQEKQEKAKDP